MACLDLGDIASCPLCHVSFEVGIDRPVIRGDNCPALLCLPGGVADYAKTCDFARKVASSFGRSAAKSFAKAAGSR